MTARPSQLPRMRRQTLHYLKDPSSALRSGTSTALAPGLDALASHLEAAEMYWVQQDMAALSMHASRSKP